MTEPAHDPFADLTATCDRLVRATIALYVVLAVIVGAGFWLEHRQSAQGAKAHTALCAFREDLRGRLKDVQASIRTSEQFLRDHPAGIPGVPVELLRQSIADKKRTARNQAATLKSLDDLTC